MADKINVKMWRTPLTTINEFIVYLTIILMAYKCVYTVREQRPVWKLCFTDGRLNSDYGIAK